MFLRQNLHWHFCSESNIYDKNSVTRATTPKWLKRSDYCARKEGVLGNNYNIHERCDCIGSVRAEPLHTQKNWSDRIRLGLANQWCIIQLLLGVRKVNPNTRMKYKNFLLKVAKHWAADRHSQGWQLIKINQHPVLQDGIRRSNFTGGLNAVCEHCG